MQTSRYCWGDGPSACFLSLQAFNTVCAPRLGGGVGCSPGCCRRVSIPHLAPIGGAAIHADSRLPFRRLRSTSDICRLRSVKGPGCCSATTKMPGAGDGGGSILCRRADQADPCGDRPTDRSPETGHAARNRLPRSTASPARSPSRKARTSATSTDGSRPSPVRTSRPTRSPRSKDMRAGSSCANASGTWTNEPCRASGSGCPANSTPVPPCPRRTIASPR